MVDWDGDGDLDLIMSDATARQTVYMNVGGRGSPPRLAPPQPLYSDGLELHGPWRVRPAVARLNGRMVYVMLDDSNELHAYYRTDDFNVKDAGKLKLKTGKPIGTHFLAGGATGRVQVCVRVCLYLEPLSGQRWLFSPLSPSPRRGAGHDGCECFILNHELAHQAAFHPHLILAIEPSIEKIVLSSHANGAKGRPLCSAAPGGLLFHFVSQLHLADFDLDGVVDLLVAVPRHASVPEPEMGLPRSLGLPGGAVLFLKGKKEVAGELPQFKFPEVLHHAGAPLFIGREDGAFALVHGMGGSKVGGWVTRTTVTFTAVIG